MITARAFAGKHYAVYGLARSGLATVEALLASGAKVTAWDDTLLPGEGRGPGGRGAAVPPALDPGLRRGTAIANLNEADLTQFDSLVVTPGLPLNRHPIAKRARDANLEIIGDIELFARARPELPPHKVVGITGTNGKSTTTALIHHILKTAGVRTTMGGNIGLPILAQDPLPEGGVYVLELSSYQIDLTQSLDCDVAVLLNITPDHLDRYASFEAYAASKMRLFAMQSHDHVGVDASGCDRWLDVIGPGQWSHRSSSHAIEYPDQENWPALQGPHNAENAWAAYNACFDLFIGKGVKNSSDKIFAAFKTYPGLPHRMERVGNRDGVLFVNDSKATNPTATAPALAAFDRIRWICGGQAKTDNLDECAPHFAHVRTAYTIGEAADLFERLLSPHIPVKNCGKLDEAVRSAAADSEPGDTVLLSPACASFDQFRDFEDRGNQFRQLVGAL
ncbi:MAG TPA: UDP-N-acetylmuramoyl-L-alanine--D-glutamate ligase [Sphingomicrobium sp.]|nr:UDP-N-acetylmuramoyl-L-alanine--D-glutamate ligase [Sphingomicrobium sp.]